MLRVQVQKLSLYIGCYYGQDIPSHSKAVIFYVTSTSCEESSYVMLVTVVFERCPLVVLPQMSC